MAGGGPHSTFYFPSERLGAVKTYTEKLVEEKFYCFPNPTLDGQTNLHYLLGERANLTFTFYDMVGQKVTREIRKYNVEGGIEDIQPWDGSSLPTGVYRCILEAEFDDGEKLSTFTDIAIIK